MSNFNVDFTVNTSQVVPEVWVYIDQNLSRDKDWYLVSCVEAVTIEGARSFSTFKITFQPPETAMISDIVEEIDSLASKGVEFRGMRLSPDWT